MAEAKAEAQESSSPRCLLLLAGGLPSSAAERFCLLVLASRFPTEHVSGISIYNTARRIRAGVSRDMPLLGPPSFRRVGLYSF